MNTAKDTTTSTADRRAREALRLLTELLTIPDERPGAWEAPHVEALQEPLGHVFDTLTGAAEQPDLAEVAR